MDANEAGIHLLPRAPEADTAKTRPAKKHLTPPEIVRPDVPAPEAPAREPRRTARLVTRLLRHPRAVDAALLLPMFLLVSMRAPIGSLNPLLVAVIATLTSTSAASSTGVYAIGATDSNVIAWKRGLAALGVCTGLFLLVAYLTNFQHDRAWLPAASVGAVWALTLHRAAVFTLCARATTMHPLASRVALLGDADAIAQFDELEHLDARSVVVQRTRLETYDDIRPALRHVDQLIKKVHHDKIDRIVVLAAAPGMPVVNAIVRRCSMSGVGVDLLTGVTRVRPSRLDMGSIHGFSTVHIRPGLRGPIPLATKRVFDLIIASLALVALAPVMGLAALAVKLGSRGPVFYKQRRLGRGGQQFEMIKFRSMMPGADQMVFDLTDQNDADGPLFKMKNDPRVTRIGGILRRTSMDELPQLWNVLRGQMSLVGPRPALAAEADGWPIELFDRLEVSPGITGLWQVSGRSNTSFADYERLDLYYVDNWTLGLDIAILARTIPALLGRGAY